MSTDPRDTSQASLDAAPTAQPAVQTTAQPAPQPTKPPWRWLVGFCLARGLFSMAQTTYSASLPVLQTEWSMTAEQSGLISSAFYGGFLFSLFAVGFMADRFGAKRTYLSTSVVAALSALAFAFFAHDFSSAFVLYGLTGLFAGGSYTPGLAILAQRFAAVGRGRAIGFYIAASSAGYAVSLLLSSAMLSNYGWREAFIVTCFGPTLGMVVGLWVLWRVPNVIPAAPPKSADGGLIRAAAANKPALLIVLAYTFHSWEVLGLWAWTPYFLAAAYGGEEVGVAAASVGAIFTAAAYGVSVAGPITGGALSDRLGRSAVIGLLSAISTVCAFTLGWLAAAPFVLAVAVAFLFQFASIGDSPVLSTALTELVHPRYLGAAYALRSVLGFGAGAVSPWAFGVVLDTVRATPGSSETLAFGLAFSTLGVVGMLCPLTILLLRRLPESRRMAGGKG